jgi:hypothetical protein
MKRLISLLFILKLYLITSGQTFEWKAGFNGFFDNREYFNDFTEPQTIFGSRFFAEAGIALNDYNRFKAGLNWLYEFGSKGDLTAPDITMYYNGLSKHINFFIGAFPRRDIICHPLILLKDTLEYFRPNIDGMFLELQTNWGYHNIWIDWTSRQTNVKRETFLIGGEGTIKKGVFFYQHNFIMYHFAGPAIPIPDDHIRDNGGLTVSLGLNLSSKIHLDSIIIASGLALSYDRIRSIYDFNFPCGWLNSIKVIHRGFGINTIYYTGDSQVLLYGDGFYKSETYGRVDLFYEGNNSDRIKGKLQFSFHFIPGTINCSQSFAIYLSLEGRRNIVTNQSEVGSPKTED